MAITIRSGGAAAAQTQYRTEVQGVLNEVRRTRTGRLVLSYLNHAAHDVVIEPNLAADGHNNAFERAASHVHGGNTRVGVAARGSRSMVEFSVRRLRGTGVQFAPHEVLLHELCHSLRTVMGRTRYNGAGDSFPMAGGFENVEEFFAAMVTSVHSSELGRRALGNHGQWPLPSVDALRRPPFDTRLRNFNTSMPAFTRDIRNIPADIAPFNPFRDVAAP